MHDPTQGKGGIPPPEGPTRNTGRPFFSRRTGALIHRNDIVAATC
jgi:hypothetical protein